MANLLARRRNDPLAPLFDEFMGDWMLRSPLAVMPRMADMPMLRAPLDIVDKGEAFEVKMDMPGMKKEDIDVSIDGARIAIQAQAKSEREVKDGDKVLLTERSAQSFARTFELPAEVTEAGAEAHYEDGVLTLMLPKRMPQTSSRLTIN